MAAGQEIDAYAARRTRDGLNIDRGRELKPKRQAAIGQCELNVRIEVLLQEFRKSVSLHIA